MPGQPVFFFIAKSIAHGFDCDVGILKRIHVDQTKIRDNVKKKKIDPVITVQTSNGTIQGNTIEIKGESKVVYRPHDPLLNCGVRLWIETTAPVLVDGKLID